MIVEPDPPAKEGEVATVISSAVNRGAAAVAVAAVVLALVLAAVVAMSGQLGVGPAGKGDELKLPVAGKTVSGTPSRRK